MTNLSLTVLKIAEEINQAVGVNINRNLFSKLVSKSHILKYLPYS